MVADQKEEVYVCRRSWRCWLTRRLFARLGYGFEVIDATGDALCYWLAQLTGRATLPYVFVDRRPVGGIGRDQGFGAFGGSGAHGAGRGVSNRQLSLSLGVRGRREVIRGPIVLKVYSEGTLAATKRTS